MISLKKYMDSPMRAPVAERKEESVLAAVLKAYGSALLGMGNCSLEACPGMGQGLKRQLAELQARISLEMDQTAIEASDRCVQEQLEDWGSRTARHFQEKAAEVKDLLLAMARTAESVGARDQRCAGQMDEVTTRLKAIASLDDLTEIRASIHRSAAELKTSIDRMTAEGKAVLDQLRKQVSTYQVKLEEAEEIASRDVLTGLRSRLCVENMIASRIALGASLCLAMVDIDGFKKVNDDYGHLTGDELLKQFASELKSACRSTDVIGRWGGDEFVILLNCSLLEARERIDRLKKWVCGEYTFQGPTGMVKLKMDASIGLAEYVKGEPEKALLARADAAMYEHKGALRKNEIGAMR
jgi:diguanylate cyclase